MKTLLPAFLILLSFSSFAQSGNKTTALASRVIASSNYKYNGSTFFLSDTSNLTYTGDHGGAYPYTTGYAIYPFVFSINYPKCDLMLGQTYDASISAFRNSSRITQTLDAAHNPIMFANEQWDVATSAWKGLAKVLYTYIQGPSGELISEEVQQSWDAPTTSWKNSSKYIIFYNGDALADTIITQNWDAATSTWKNSTQLLYTYDGNGNNTLIYSNKWDVPTSSWKSSTRLYNVFNNNVKTSMMAQTYNSATSAWDNKDRELYTYDGINNLLTDTYEKWNSATSMWDGYNKNIYTYDGSNRMLTDIYQTWDGVTSSYKNSTFHTYTYDGNGNRLTDIEQDWISNAWKNYYRHQYTSNSYNQRTSDISDRWNSGGFWEFVANSGDGKTYYYYQEYTLGVNDPITVDGGNLVVYPNPASNVLQINLQWKEAQPFTVSITDITGRVVKQYSEPAAKQYSRTIVTSDLQNGTYFIKAAGVNAVASQQFIIQR
ncbi:MAG: T9SS type A sorting domain-containing protein [Bacteroidetes bacterium]|nr:T9SS type A sorting domain-containing protein [Bacteroidota bacterium]